MYFCKPMQYHPLNDDLTGHVDSRYAFLPECQSTRYGVLSKCTHASADNALPVDDSCRHAIHFSGKCQRHSQRGHLGAQSRPSPLFRGALSVAVAMLNATHCATITTFFLVRRFYPFYYWRLLRIFRYSGFGFSNNLN